MLEGDVSTLSSLIMPLINEIGFPIFVSIYLLRMKSKQDSNQQKLIDELKCVQDSLLETKLQLGREGEKP